MSNKNLLIRIYRVAQDSSKSFTILIVSSVDHKSSSEMILCNFFFTLCALFKVISSQFSYSATTYVEEQCFFSMSHFWWQDIKKSQFFRISFSWRLIRSRRTIRSFRNSRRSAASRRPSSRIVIHPTGKVAWGILRRLRARWGRRPASASANRWKPSRSPGPTRTSPSGRRTCPRASASRCVGVHLVKNDRLIHLSCLFASVLLL